MNRLWVRISLVIALVAVIIALFPSATSRLWLPQREPPPIPTIQPPRDLSFAPGASPPVEQIGEQIARVQQEREARISWLTRAMTAFGAVVALGVGIWLSRSLVKPLIALEKGAKEVAAHNLTYRVPEAGSREMKTVAHAFNEMASELKRAQTLRHNLLADVSHELRHPIHVLRGNVQGILDGVFPLEVQEMVILSEQIHHLAQLVEDLHELALAEAHELPMDIKEVNLTQLVQDSLDAIRPLAIDKDIALNTELATDSIELVGDGGRIKQVIQNLLSNAIRYTLKGGEITISLKATADFATIAITDTGIGITADNLPHVFDRFYRTDISRKRAGGTGLGLAIVQAIVQAHNGTITATSPGVDLGSTFTIDFPLNEHM